MSEANTWTGENATRAFPLLESGAVPDSFVVDARVSVPGEGGPVTLDVVGYDPDADEWTIGVTGQSCSFGPVVVARDAIAPRMVLDLFDAQTGGMAILTFGDAWTDPSLWGVDWTAGFAGVGAEFAPAVLVPGNKPVLGFLINDETPESPLVPRGPFATQVFMAGHNVTFTGSGDGRILLGVEAGAGEGLWPCGRTGIRTINGAAPDPRGRLLLHTGSGLSWSVKPAFDGGVDAPNDLWLLSERGEPCCDCDDYNKVSAAISRLSSKFRDINEDLKDGTECMQEHYDEGVKLVLLDADSAFVVHSIRVFPTYVSFTLQSACADPGWAMIALDTETPELVLDQACRSYVTEGRATPAPLPPNAPDPPEDFSEDKTVFTVVSDDGTLLDPGEAVNIFFYNPESVSAFNVALRKFKLIQNFLSGKPYQENHYANVLKEYLEALMEFEIEDICINGQELGFWEDDACRHQFDRAKILRDNANAELFRMTMEDLFNLYGNPYSSEFPVGDRYNYGNVDTCAPIGPNTYDKTWWDQKLRRLMQLNFILNRYNMEVPRVEDVALGTAGSSGAPIYTSVADCEERISAYIPKTLSAAATTMLLMGLPYMLNRFDIRAFAREVYAHRADLMEELKNEALRVVGVELEAMKAFLTQQHMANKLDSPFVIECIGAVGEKGFDCGFQRLKHKFGTESNTPEGFTGEGINELASLIAFYQERRRETTP